MSNLPKPYYQDDACTIYHGDCREILPLLPKVDLVLTDPPYGICVTGGTWGKQFDSTYQNWDAKPFDDIALIVSAGSQAVVWGGNYFSMPPSRGWFIWKKPFLNTLADAEMAWTNADRNTRVFESTRSPDGKREHPTQKPLELMSWCLSFYPTAQTILDPFMGSGTTLRAAKDLGRKAIGIELEEKYCEIAARRLEQECIPFAEEIKTKHDDQIFMEGVK